MSTRTDDDRTALRVGTYLIALALVFATAFGVGRLLGPEPEPTPPPQHSNHLGAENIGAGQSSAGEHRGGEYWGEKH